MSLHTDHRVYAYRPSSQWPTPQPVAGDVAPHGLVKEIAEQFQQQGIEYCQWKGTFNRPQALAGEKDIDLLVSYADVSAAVSILWRLGFKEAEGAALETLPGTRNFFGYDSETGRIVHIHLHDEIVLGHPLQALYHLPVEKACLASSDPTELIPATQPEFEFVLFCLRMVLDRTASRRRFWKLHPALLSPARQREYEHLRARVSAASLDCVLRTHFPELKPTVFHACVQALSTGVFEGRGPMQQLRRQLDRFRLRRGLGGFLSVLWHRGCRAVRVRVWRQPVRKQRFISGGTMIAVVGGDGAGKSTVIEELRTWLASHFDVRTAHLGRPRRSLTTWTVRGLLKFGRKSGRLFARRVWGGRFSGLDLSPLLWSYLVARDRNRAFQTVRRQAATGRVVLCDRWPLPHILSMDGPQIGKMADNGQMNRLLTWLAKREEHWYRVFGEPNCLVVVRLAPELAVLRKPEEDPDFVRRRAHEVWTAPWHQSSALVVDASQPLDRVVAQVKEHVWSAL